MTWSPTDLGSSLVAWYDASDIASITQSGGVVSAWRDKSGNAYHFAQATASLRPAYNGTGFQRHKPAIACDGIDDVLVTSSFTLNSAQFSVFAFMGTETGIRAAARMLLAYDGVNEDSNTSCVLFEITHVNGYIGTSRNSVITTTTIDQVVPSAFYRFATVFDGAQNVLYLDNADVFTGASSGSLAATSLRLGKNVAGDLPYTARVSEILIMNRVATALERASIDQHFLRAWPRYLTAEGDSIVANFNEGQAYLKLFIPNAVPSCFVRNLAVIASTLASLNSRAARTDLYAPAARSGLTRIFYVSVGTNDFITAFDVPAFAESLATYCANRKAAGYEKVVVGTILSRTDGFPLYEPQRLAYNAIIRAPGWAAAHGIDAIVDFASDPIMGVTNSPTLYPAYWQDGVHPNTAGNARMEPYFTAVINGLEVAADTTQFRGGVDMATYHARAKARDLRRAQKIAEDDELRMLLEQTYKR